MTTILLSIALCAVPAGDVPDPVRTNIDKTIEMIHQRSGMDSIEGVFRVDHSGQVLDMLLERVCRPYGQRGRYSTPHSCPVLATTGICDDLGDCEKKVKELCKEAGHCGVTEGTVSITNHDNGGATCSGDCSCNGAVAFATCPGKPNKP